MNVDVREDTRSALGLMQTVLRGGDHLAPEYPLVFQSGATARVIVAEESGSIRSSCAILERDLLVGASVLRVGLIGSVVTAADYRGRGLASAVLARAEEELRASGCLFAMLWADSPKYYEGRGYCQLGSEHDFLLAVELAQSLPLSSDVRLARPADFDQMHTLYTQHAQRVLRSARESRALLATPGMEVLVHDSGAGIQAYACRGRGQDLEQVVHEWAGDARAVLACLRAHLEAAAARGKRELYLMSPVGAHPVTHRLLELSVPSALGVLGMGKLLHRGQATSILAAACDAPLEWRAQQNGGCVFEVRGRKTELNDQELLQSVLSTRGERAALDDLETRLEAKFRGLPLEPFLWGLDSI